MTTKMFNPRPLIRSISLPGFKPCVVIDDFLLDPEKMLAFAAARRAAFAVDAGNYFPGPEVAMPSDFTALLSEFFTLHIRPLLGGRRTLQATSRLSMVTKPPGTLQPLQRICHSDTMVGTRRVDSQAGEAMAASVLYLFRDPDLGGTSFYKPRRPPEEIAALNWEARALTGEAFSRLLGGPPGYLTSSNGYFEQIGTVPAAYNRAIFYDGAILHSGQIDRPERLSNDPEEGRLTLNGFFLHRLTASEAARHLFR
ncbi:hypothetical protein G4G28_17420 [Massilia sp. Dwa41.01b]|uniref:DUF6445 family protein n=1 Tax=unclassified Massilia TaxID=2609279 RepID=UPI001600B8CA|nr:MULTISPECIES: DUF6445 family protein [unclassified Massilia]QNA89816.1 hypothetical protein G4G28_17420 [Massilia sp. Dwa41.01b]QNB00710.1 hypothetical protein G4G31_20990 [Massilia sp. Se16.2.3]